MADLLAEDLSNLKEHKHNWFEEIILGRLVQISLPLQ